MDKGADCVIAGLDAQKQARVALLEPLGVVAGKRTFSSIACITVQVNANKERLVFHGARSAKFAIGYWSNGCTNAPGPIF